MSRASRTEVCVVALAECFRGDGEIMASPMGTLPSIAGHLARATFAPDLMLTDGVASLVAGDEAFPGPEAAVVESYCPYRTVFDLAWSGRRHVVMGASQLDPWGNQNIAAIGDFAAPRAQLIGFRGAPGNTVNHATSYWVPRHSTRVFVERVDVVTGVGWDRAAGGGGAMAHLDLRRVVSNLAVMDFGGPGHRMRLVSVHPGVHVAEVTAATGFELVGAAGDVPSTRLPSQEELRLLREVIDPRRHRDSEGVG